jgi:FKBP-type peptidyl-prolyl cis-trans isomerase SlyD
MNIEKNSVVLIHYRLSNDAKEVLEDAMTGEPIALLHGHGNIIPGLETALLGRAAGDEFEVIVEPVDGYGVRKDDQIQRLSKKYFVDAKRLKPGMQTVVQTKDGQRAVTVHKVGGKVIDVDLNHPLAGQRLHFLLNIVAVREATASELAHGHAHAEGQEHH